MLYFQTTSSVLLLANLSIVPTRRCNRMHRKNMKHFVCIPSMLADVGKVRARIISSHDNKKSDSMIQILARSNLSLIYLPTCGN